MNAIDLLGDLLTRRSPKADDGGLGQQALQRVLEKQRRERAAQHANGQQTNGQQTNGQQTNGQPLNGRQSEGSHKHGGQTLEHVLHDVYGRWQKSRYKPAPAPRNDRHDEEHNQVPAPPHHGYDDNQLNQRAVILIRAMVNAAKADGQIDQREQERILNRLGRIDSEEAAFLRQEFQRPVNVHEFAHDVPHGMEEEVYAMSLMAIDLDHQNEARYLHHLAECLRMDPRVCNQIHAHYGEPAIFR